MIREPERIVSLSGKESGQLHDMFSSLGLSHDLGGVICGGVFSWTLIEMYRGSLMN